MSILKHVGFYHGIEKEKLLEVDPLLSTGETPIFVTHPGKQDLDESPLATNLIQLMVRSGEFIYARFNDIALIESWNHFDIVYVVTGDKIKRLTRRDTLKHIYNMLPSEIFVRLGRFLIVNTTRLSGANFKEQTLEFDFQVKIKLEHATSLALFSKIGK
jgi:DNA-binding LytR/AlgR family response regulator